jgi:KUP system potassium uptake protein
MSVTRRQLLTGGAAGVGLAVAGSLPALAQAPTDRTGHSGGDRPETGPTARPFPPLEDDPAGILALRYRWHQPWWVVVTGATVFGVVDLLFFAANLTKLAHGAWLPLLIGLVVFVLLTTWQRGRTLVTDRRQQEEGSLRGFVETLHSRRPSLPRVPGTGVFLNRGKATTPLALRATVKHLHVLPRCVVILSIETRPVPYVAPEDRVAVDDLTYTDDEIVHVTAAYGYMEDADIPAVLEHVSASGGTTPIETGDASYFLSTIEPVVGDAPGMARWRKRLFVATAAATTDAAT